MPQPKYPTVSYISIMANTWQRATTTTTMINQLRTANSKLKTFAIFHKRKRE